MTVSELVMSQIDQWEASGQIGALVAQGYTESLQGEIRPYLGNIPIPKLTTLHIEKWHAALRTRSGKAGRPLSPTTMRRSHSVLSWLSRTPSGTTC